MRISTVVSLVYPPSCLLCSCRLHDSQTLFCQSCGSCLPRLLPPVCERCGLPLGGGHDLRADCRDCQRRRLAFSRARAPLLFAGKTREAIHRFKYEGNRRIGVWLVEQMARQAAAFEMSNAGWSVVSVPMPRLKARLRGMDSSRFLARGLARAAGLGYEGGMLRRCRWTRSQTRLHPKERFRNVERAFRAQPSVAGRSILLVDDVLTTGATANACASALLSAGAVEVAVMTAARAPAAEPST
ncbi:MAG: ComF family protein [Candidatus Omnitrophica bacterium]|nr:ComF family protein [Candidatus Omnitrophota bacterium]